MLERIQLNEHGVFLIIVLEMSLYSVALYFSLVTWLKGAYFVYEKIATFQEANNVYNDTH